MLSLRRSCLLLTAAFSLPSFPSRAQDFKKQVIYQIVTDRFYNGSHANDDPAVSKGLYDATHTNWQAYWGGDLQGIQAKMPYLKGMGVTALWISPAVDNENKPLTPPGSLAPYHGYHARDFTRVEEHFGDLDNGWTTFDKFIASAHGNGMKVVLDWANNHSNDQVDGEKGALYNGATLLGTAADDPGKIFHHNPDIGDGDYDDRYRAEYYSLSGLTDLDQENSTVDSYLKSAALLFQSHGVDAFRLDALKHVNWGWEYSFANTIYSSKPSFLFGEWITDTGNPIYRDAVKFANRSGISELDFAVNRAARDVFANDKPFSELEEAITTENNDFASPNDLVVFFDSHDEARLLSMKNVRNRVNEALAFTLTCRGIPVVMYGDEQYLHKDTHGGGDPYNRVQMSAWSTATTAYKLIRKLADLRQSNDALGYGTWQQRYVSNDVYIYERRFFGNVVLVAINKSETAKQKISTGLLTSLPAGTYADFLGQLMGGQSLTVGAGSDGNNPAAALTLPPHSVSVWQAQAAATAPQVGSIGPAVGQPGMAVTIAGEDFGTAQGSVKINSATATVTSWSNNSVTFTVPSSASGASTAILTNAAGVAANPIRFTVLEARLVPVTFTVNSAIPTQPGDNIFLTGGGFSLGNWGTSFDTAVGPMLTPNNPNWFLNVSVPAGQAIQFKFIKIAADGTVTWEGGSNHTYTVPVSGTGAVTVEWQP